MDRGTGFARSISPTGARLVSWLRQAVPLRRKQLIVVAYTLPSQTGHYFNELLGYKTGAKALGLACRIVLPRSCAPHLAALLGAETVLEALPPMGEIASPNILEKAIAFLRAAEDLASLWAAIERRHPTSADMVLFTFAHPMLIAGTGMWLDRRSPKQRPSVFFRLVGDEFVDHETGEHMSDAPFFRLACADLRTRPGQERVCLLAAGAAMVRVASRIGGRRAFVMPLPKHLIAAAENEAPALGQHVVHVHVNHRSLPLVDGLADIIRQVTAAVPTTRFVIKDSGLPTEYRARLASKVASLPAEMLPAEQDATAYLANFSRCTVVLLAYDPRRYERLTSGVYVEAASFGKPVVVPAGTWMAQEIAAGRGAGTVFAEPNPASVSAALLHALNDADSLAAAARAAAPRIRAENSCRHYVENMMTLAWTMPDMEPRYEIGDEIDFSDPYYPRSFMRGEWGHTEHWGVWTISRRADLVFRLESTQAVILRVLVRPFLSPAHRRLVVRVMAGRQEVAQWSFDFDNSELQNSQWCEASIPSRSANARNRNLDISFVIENPASPSAGGSSTDTRLLGLGFFKLVLQAVESTKPMDQRTDAGAGQRNPGGDENGAAGRRGHDEQPMAGKGAHSNIPGEQQRADDPGNQYRKQQRPPQ